MVTLNLRQRPIRLGQAAVALGMGLLACSEGSGPSGPAEPPAAIAIASGNDQEGKVNEALAEPFVVRVTDGEGDGVAGVAVAWSVTSGGGTLASSSTLTDGDGLGRVYFIPKALGTSAVTASVTGLQGSPAIFTAEATVLVIRFESGFSPGMLDPRNVTVPVGTTLEWLGLGGAYSITSISAPPGGEPFASGTVRERFRFVPGVVGTWEYQAANGWDEITFGSITAR